ncbi:type I restriction endonuclease EcoprrI subunit S [Marinilactibacillus psychrotolerans]|uniref:restriction endonuclease subunit S n=1 Tax=Marinilactibacillus psychrotolerans TaxID=191770 RepID=UPI001DE3A898|nr:restriction endonuclease subunit S [Marinilactibacillus psychrotolerans]GEQ33617.1 type I restriction endonuclease EcoprrI subunit S [Marinilactibacillus psychrotolerans]
MMKSIFMDELLDGVDVEWKALSEIAVLKRGRVMSKGYLIENKGEFPVFSSQTANNGMIGSIDTFDFDGEFVNWTTDGANAGTVFYRTGKFSITNVSGLIKIKNESMLNYKYLFYWLSIEAKKHVYSGMGNPKLMSKQVAKISVPIPPLEIQAKIVRILDTFTELTTELTAELTARKKQYNYYREQLLTFEEGEVEWKALGETLVRTKGTKITAGQMKELHKINAPLKIFAGGKTIAFVDFEDIPKKDINREPSIIVKSRGNIEFEYYDKPFSHKNEMWSYHSKNKNINIKFVYYFLKINELYFQNIGSRMQMPQIATPDTDKFKIPVPPIEEQERIVSILDKFDALTTSITEGLPHEIELRQKQYEYYRNMLLSFPKEEV